MRVTRPETLEGALEFQRLTDVLLLLAHALRVDRGEHLAGE
jgi:hypothetical protein